MKTKIVVIEDEPDILEVLRYNLEREGFDVKTAENGLEGVNAVRGAMPDLVLLDLLLPGIDGLEVCRRLKSQRTTNKIPIIMITAKGEESDIVLGLGLGADDYVTKPFSSKEVIARAKAVLRRAKSVRATPEESDDRVLQFEGLVLDPVRHKISVDGTEVNFTATEFRLLHNFASRPERVLTREQLMDRAIGDGAVVLDRNIDVHVRSIRNKIGRYRGLIETVRGVGYRFQPPT